MKKLDVSKWKRKEHFEFFSKFDDPTFGIVSHIDCTFAYRFSKEKKSSFFAYYLHKSIIAANQIEEFRYRIQDDKVIIYDTIYATTTIARKDNTFAFSFIGYDKDFAIFETYVQKEIEETQKTTGLRLRKDSSRQDVIHYSCLPWFEFTGLKHPKNFHPKNSIPKIVFGKIFTKEEKIFLPISIEAHHGLMDGWHLGEFLRIFQELMNL